MRSGKSARQYVERLRADMAARRPLPRDLSEVEMSWLTEVREAGAVIIPRLLREYLSGEPVCPFQFEGCSYSVQAGDAWAHPIVAENIAKRDAFLAGAASSVRAA